MAHGAAREHNVFHRREMRIVRKTLIGGRNRSFAFGVHIAQLRRGGQPDDDDEDDSVTLLRIEIKIEADKAKVKITQDGTEEEREFTVLTREEIVAALAESLGLTEDEVDEAITKFEIED